MPKYHYCSYWHRWSRVLSDSHQHGPYVELNLTPIHHSSSSSWDNDVRSMRVRFHGTARDRRDIDTDELPEEVRAEMVAALGEELVEHLLTDDILPLIDYDLYRRHCNGGANLDDIRVRAA